MQAVLDAVGERLMKADESLIRIPEICEATGVNYGSCTTTLVRAKVSSTRPITDVLQIGRGGRRGPAVGERLVKDLRRVLESLQGLIGLSPRAMTPLRRALRAGSLPLHDAPELRELIGTTQSRLTAELQSIVEYGQQREWLNRELSRARSRC